MCLGEMERWGWGGVGGREQGTVRIHAVLASPQQLHQYCIQLGNWQRSSVLRLQARTAKESNTAPPSPPLRSGCAGGGLCEGQSTLTLTQSVIQSHTHIRTHQSLCCIKRQERRVRRGAQTGNTPVDRANPREGHDCKGNHVLICYCAPQGNLSTGEFD